nr:MAG TPA: hypothetical protein [Caudoviricetes sp.]
MNQVVSSFLFFCVFLCFYVLCLGSLAILYILSTLTKYSLCT